MSVSLNLLVLRCQDIEKSKAFYMKLGIDFKKEKHGAGQEHFAAVLGSLVFELYPLHKSEIPDKTRLGFSYSDFAEISRSVLAANISIVNPAQEIGGRLVLVVQDPDGRKVELTGIAM